MKEQPVAVVTGGLGFIGSHMVDHLLARDFRVRVMDNCRSGQLDNLKAHAAEPRLVVEEKDIRTIDPTDPLFADARFVFHFAGVGDIVPSIDEPAEYLSINVQGTVAVLEAARASGVKRFIYAASSSCYGIANVPTTENDPIDPRYPYALSKYLGEETVVHWGKVYRLPVNSIRIFNAYGPRVRSSSHYGAVFGVLLKQKLEGEPMTIVGDGTQKRDFVYVTDVADGFFKVASSDCEGEIFNLASGNPRAINEVAAIIGGPTVSIPKRPGEPDCTWADITKIKNLVGWQAKVSLEEGIQNLLDQIEDWRLSPLWTPRNIHEATNNWFKYLNP